MEKMSEQTLEETGEAVEATRYGVDQHNIQQNLISANALKVCSGLREAGYEALLVGGCVRDLMLEREPKDFDVATNAHPEEVKKVFRQTRLIGRRFRLAHVRFGREIIEVATYRGQSDVDEDEPLLEAEEQGNIQNGLDGEHSVTESGMILRDNVYGDQPEDALRRDFSMNALYYDPATETVIDYAGGVEAIRAQIIRVIGDPQRRFREDPVRMLRAIRFAAKLDFALEPECSELIPRLSHLLAYVSPARLFDEVLKLFHSGAAVKTFVLLRKNGLLQFLLPLSEEALDTFESRDPDYRSIIITALANTDKRVKQGKPVIPAFLFAALLWEALCILQRDAEDQGMTALEAYSKAEDSVLSEQCQCTVIPRRVSGPVREIWRMQRKLEQRRSNQIRSLFQDKRFRAAYDFMLLRASIGELEQSHVDWWDRWQAADEEQRTAICRENGGGQHADQQGNQRPGNKNRVRRSRTRSRYRSRGKNSQSH